MITPRSTRLIRTRTLDACQLAIITSCRRDPAEVRGTLVLVPTRSAARRLRLTIEERPLADAGSASPELPDVLTRTEMYERLLDALPEPRAWLSPYERETLLEAGAHAAITDGVGPPFHLRAALLGEMLELYDALLRYRQTVDDFERLLEGELQPQAAADRGAERLLRQTRFLAASFRHYAREVGARESLDEHELRALLLQGAASSPWSRVVVTVGDRAAERGGLWPADFDLLTRLDGIDRIDVIATEAQLTAGLHTRIHDLLPGIEEQRFEEEGGGAPAPALVVPEGTDRRYFVSRDREEELAAAIRLVRQRRRAEGPEAHRLDRTAIVFARPLPYLYPARELFESGGVPFQCDDSLPLAAEPVAAAVDLVLAFIASQASREATVALLRSPHLVLADGSAAGETLQDTPRTGWRASVAALDAVMLESAYLGGAERLEALAADLARAADAPGDRHQVRRRLASPAAQAAAAAARELAPLFGRAPAAAQLETLQGFVEAHEPPPAELQPRELRARRAVREILHGLTRAYRGHATLIWDIGQLAAAVHRWIEAHTFEPRTGEEGVHLLDAVAARYGSFDDVHLVGLVEGEWPERQRRNIFYSSFLLRRLGWPDEGGQAAERAAFFDLLRLARRRTVVSTVQLENEALAEPSALLDELSSPDLTAAPAPPVSARSFVHEALLAQSIPEDAVPEPARRWLAVRRAQRDPRLPAFHGRALSGSRSEYGVSSVEIYTQCPFKYFARHVLGLDEEHDEREGLSPRDRGVFVHEVLQAFFEQWIASGGGAITADRLDAARRRLEEVAEPLLARLAPVDAALERARLFGSAAAPGVADLVLRMEVDRAVAVVGRRLEERFSGVFELEGDGGRRRLPIRGIVDRIDLLADGSVRVLDYKSYVPASPVQLAIYAVTAAQRLRDETGRVWRIGEAGYVVYGGRREVRPVEGRGASLSEALGEAQRRFVSAVDAIGAGEFPIRPIQRRLCVSCPYDAVCRKDYAAEPGPEDVSAV